MLVHAPIACWLLTPASDGAALALGSAFFWQVSALLAAAGALLGAAAATAGAMDYPRASARAPDLVRRHAGLMASAWTIAIFGLLGRIGETYQALTPPPLWTVAAGGLTFLLMLAGAYYGGEMVYGRGVGVRP